MTWKSPAFWLTCGFLVHLAVLTGWLIYATAPRWDLIIMTGFVVFAFTSFLCFVAYCRWQPEKNRETRKRTEKDDDDDPDDDGPPSGIFPFRRA